MLISFKLLSHLQVEKEKSKFEIESSFNKLPSCKPKIQSQSSNLKISTMAVGINKHLEAKEKKKLSLSADQR